MLKDLVLRKENNELVLDDLVQQYLNYIDVNENTARTYNVGLFQFREYLRKNNIRTPQREDIINFREYLKEEHKPNTVNSYMIAVRNFYGWLEYESIAKDISRKIKGVKMERVHLKRGLSKDEIQKVLDVCENTREELLFKLMITCALRVNEVRNIKLEDFYMDKGVILLKVLGKARDGLKQDSVKIDDRLFELIKDYCVQYDVKDYLFYSMSNENYGSMVSGVTISAKELAKAGVVAENFTEMGMVTLKMNLVIQIIMITAAALMIIFCKASPKKAVAGPVWQSGMVAVVAIYGIAWMADTYFGHYMPEIQSMLEGVVKDYPWTIALVFFAVSVLINSQGAVVVAMLPLAYSLGISGVVLLGVLPSVYGYFFIPNYPSDIATVNFDRSGTTVIGKYLLNHSFMMPGLICVFVSTIVAYLLTMLIF